jgi:hypothetical protein
MNASEKFYRILDKMTGPSRREGLDITVEPVREAFAQAMGRTPEGLCGAIFLRFLDAFNRSGKPEKDFVESAYSLGSYIDLFWMDYEGGEHPLEDADWIFLREETSAFAGELDLDILTYIMQQITSRGKI